MKRPPQIPKRAVANRRFELLHRVGQLLVDDVQIFRPVADMVDVGLAVGNAAQADQRNAESLAARRQAKVSMSTMSSAMAS